jgi:hypothetical protein
VPRWRIKVGYAGLNKSLLVRRSKVRVFVHPRKNQPIAAAILIHGRGRIGEPVDGAG